MPHALTRDILGAIEDHMFWVAVLLILIASI
jgi:hypothetical protein